MCPDPETLALADVAEALKAFDCVSGDPRAYHTTADGQRYHYSTLGFRGASLLAVSAALASSIRSLATDLRIRIPLYLRSGPTIERDVESNDWCIRIRLAAPGANWTKVTAKPEGAPYPQV